jgi:hypothetical protein
MGGARPFGLALLDTVTSQDQQTAFAHWLLARCLAGLLLCAEQVRPLWVERLHECVVVVNLLLGGVLSWSGGEHHNGGDQQCNCP